MFPSINFSFVKVMNKLIFRATLNTATLARQNKLFKSFLVSCLFAYQFVMEKYSGNTGRVNRNVYGILKFTKQPKTLKITFKNMPFSEGNQLFSGAVLQKVNAGMRQFTKKQIGKWIVKHQEYFCRRLPVKVSSLSSLSDGWAKYKEKVPDVSDSNQNVETTCNSKLRFTELKDLFIKRVQKKVIRD